MKKIGLSLLYITISFFAPLQCSSSKEAEKTFTYIHDKGKWGSKESVSGPGSTIGKTKSIRAYLPQLVERLNIKSILDAPCGDFNWMKLIIKELNLDQYIGIDIVKKLITKNNKYYGNEATTFKFMDLVNDEIPQVDLIICRDCLVHLPYKDIVTTMKNFKKSGSKYILITTFLRDRPHKDIKLGGWRWLNLFSLPFNFPEPLEIINEGYHEPYADKSIALWRLEDINIEKCILI